MLKVYFTGSVSEVTLKHMGKLITYTNKAKHNKTMCRFDGK